VSAIAMGGAEAGATFVTAIETMDRVRRAMTLKRKVAISPKAGRIPYEHDASPGA
jgi:hypothetical protein